MSVFKKSAIALAVASSLGFSAASFAAAYSAPAPAPEAGNWYVQGFGGVALVTDRDYIATPANLALEYKVGFDAGAAVGYRSGPFRYEVQYTYVRNKLRRIGGTTVPSATDSISQNTHLGMFNVYYDFANLSDTFTPYVGAGIGVGRIETHRDRGTSFATFVTREATSFAYQGMVGFDYSVDNEWSIGPRYRYVGMSRAKNLFTRRNDAHLIELAVTYHA